MNDLFIAFDDSSSDPTYTSLSCAFLVEASDDSEGNPCGSPNAKWTPAIPGNAEELRTWAELLGWTLEARDGKLMVVTNISV